MQWSPDGKMVCIIYEDGAVIVGSVESSRLWGKKYKHRLSIVCWSPDCKLLLFGTPEGEVRVMIATETLFINSRCNVYNG